MSLVKRDPRPIFAKVTLSYPILIISAVTRQLTLIKRTAGDSGGSSVEVLVQIQPLCEVCMFSASLWVSSHRPETGLACYHILFDLCLSKHPSLFWNWVFTFSSNYRVWIPLKLMLTLTTHDNNTATCQSLCLMTLRLGFHDFEEISYWYYLDWY